MLTEHSELKKGHEKIENQTNNVITNSIVFLFQKAFGLYDP